MKTFNFGNNNTTEMVERYFYLLPMLLNYIFAHFLVIGSPQRLAYEPVQERDLTALDDSGDTIGGLIKARHDASTVDLWGLISRIRAYTGIYGKPAPSTASLCRTPNPSILLVLIPLTFNATRLELGFDACHQFCKYKNVSALECSPTGREH